MKTSGKILALSILHPMFITSLMGEFNFEYLLMVWLMAMAQVLVLYYIISLNKGLSKWSLTWRLTLLFYLSAFFQSGIEAYVFLNYMTDTMNMSEINDMIVEGVLTSVVIVPLSVYLLSKKPIEEKYIQILTPKKLVMRITGISFIYVVIYVLFGALVFIPIAGEHFQEYYGELPNPPWILPFQVARGIIWGLIAWGTIKVVSGNRKQAIMAVILMIAFPISSLLLPVNEVMPAPIRVGHLVEVTSSMLLFGWICGVMLTVKQKMGETKG